jgi:Domain of unknown function (DUF4126)
VELLTGLGLATASGLNAYIPLLALGLLSRFTDLITLPHGWVWLENGWVMAIVAVLLLIEIVADKIPALDSVNDAIQTFVRPTSGVFGFSNYPVAQALRHFRAWACRPVGQCRQSTGSPFRIWRTIASVSRRSQTSANLPPSR